MNKDLQNYFNPVHKRFSSGAYNRPGYLGAVFNQPDKKKPKVALVGVSETRNAYEGTFESDPDTIREALYGLSAHSLPAELIDLGNVIPGKTVQDTYAALGHISGILLKEQIVPVFLGGSSELMLPVLEQLKKQYFTNVLLIDSAFDTRADELHSQAFIRADDAVHYAVLGYQSYYLTGKMIDAMDLMGADYERLGKVRSAFNAMEPYFRDADLALLDLNAVRQQDCPAVNRSGPNGFYADEICRVAYLTGISDRLKVFYLAEFCSGLDVNGLGAALVAQVVWYFLNGFYNRKNDYPVRELNTYHKVYVKIEKPDMELLFYKNETNNRYWIEIPALGKLPNRIVSCSEAEYKAICNQTFPDRIWKKF